MKIEEIIHYLESLAPLSSQESYDNSGLICGDRRMELTNPLISLDCTEAIVEEAIAKKCNLIIAHHPIVFKGLKKLTGKNYVERAVLKAIRNDVAIYAIHTNLDNYRFGVNRKIGELLGVRHMQILRPAENKLAKLSVYVPKAHHETVMNALFDAGAGHIGNYSECSFSLPGHGTFKAGDDSSPYIGEKGKRHQEEEMKLEVLVSLHRLGGAVSAMMAAHPYEEVAYDVFPLLNANRYEGAGMWGQLDTEMSEVDFLQKVKTLFGCAVIRHTSLRNKPVKTVAWCGGSGSFLLPDARAVKADIFITGDFKYHEFFDAENQLVIADIGHFESEQYTIDLLNELLQKKFPNFAACLTENITNPVKYF